MRIHGHKAVSPSLEQFDITPACDLSFIVKAWQAVTNVRLTDEMIGYIVDLIRTTRDHPSLQVGASPRAANMLASASRALAILEGRDFVIPDDVKFLFRATLRHRVLLAPGAEIEGETTDEVLGQILDQVAAPR